MTNKEIAKSFQLLGQLMELHGENPYKVRSYQSAYRNLRSYEKPLMDMADEEIAAIEGVGKAIHGKIRELIDKGKMDTLERYAKQTPSGVQEMLQIKGFGAKKIRAIWRELKTETIGELLYAVNENRLIELKGFGKKTQDDLKQKLEYYQKSKDKFHFAVMEAPANALLKHLEKTLPDHQIEFTGDYRRRMPTLQQIELLIGTTESLKAHFKKPYQIVSEQENQLKILTPESLPAILHTCSSAEFGNRQLRLTGGSAFLDQLPQESLEQPFSKEATLLNHLGFPDVPAELRDLKQDFKNTAIPSLIHPQDLRGVLHAHSTYSDGLHTLEAMAKHTKELGYEYLGITDHSKSAFYANGLKEDRLLEQWIAIDQLNTSLAPFKVLKGIESDILSDGSLDYEESILKQFDFIIASVHSNLKMDENKATKRLITAIENPYTRILGHPTGRLLLSRKGYPINHTKVIDACAANGVAIELNANPYRMDLDWQWIPYALSRGVKIAINPDAHSMEGIQDMYFGVLTARKGGLTEKDCLNSMGLMDFEAWITQK